MIKLKSPKGQFHSNIKIAFLAPNFKRAPIHESLFKLDCRIVVTPNFDKIYETYAYREIDGTIIVKNYCGNDVVTDIKVMGE